MEKLRRASNQPLGARLATAKYRLRAGLGLTRPVEVHVYRGFDNGKVAFLTGRVLERKRIPPAKPDDSRWLNLRRSLSWLESDEVPFATVQIEYAGRTALAHADDEGYFTATLPTEDGPTSAWAEARVSLVSQAGQGPSRNLIHERLSEESMEPLERVSPPREPEPACPRNCADFSGEIVLLGNRGDLGIISDIDDTLLVTDVTSKVRMLYLTLFRNPLTRQPPPGTVALYRLLSASGGNPSPNRPCFYVSKSPWNLYHMLVEYMDVQGLPKGPLLLRDLDLPGVHRGPRADHKGTSIRQLLGAFPQMRFVLLGDSGERDPALFLELMREYPQRFVVGYVRRARGTARHLRRTAAALAQAQAEGLPLVFAENSEEIVRDARDRGLIGDPASPP